MILLASVVAEILKGKPQISGAPLAQGYTHFSSMGFDDGLWQTAVASQI